jgi:hypothetical protein
MLTSLHSVNFDARFPAVHIAVPEWREQLPVVAAYWALCLVTVAIANEKLKAFQDVPRQLPVSPWTILTALTLAARFLLASDTVVSTPSLPVQPEHIKSSTFPTYAK